MVMKQVETLVVSSKEGSGIESLPFVTAFPFYSIQLLSIFVRTRLTRADRRASN